MPKTFIMMKKITYHLFNFYMACTLVSCIAPAPPLEVPPGESKLVINGTFTNDENFQVVLYKIRNSSEKVYVENAEVRILSEEDELLETLTSFPVNEKSDVPCYGSVDLKAEVGKLYKINVKAPNFPDSTTAESIIPIPSGIAAGNYNISNSTVAIPNLAKGIFLQVEIEDADILEKNFFHLNFYHIVKVDVDNDGVIDPIGDPLRINKFSPNDPGSLFVQNRGILLTDRSFPYPVTKKKFIYKVEFEERILAALAGQDNFGSIHVELRTVNESYYNFMTSKIGQNNSNFNPFLNPDPEYTNVLNGLGIFSGFSTKTDTVVIVK